MAEQLPDSNKKSGKTDFWCPFCHERLDYNLVVFVSGHGQCPDCKQVIFPCCDGSPRTFGTDQTEMPQL